MVIKDCKTIEQYKICKWLSNELDVNSFVLSMFDRNVVKVIDKTGSEMLVKYENGEFKTEFI